MAKPTARYAAARRTLIDQRTVSRNRLTTQQRPTLVGASSQTVKNHKPRNWHRQRGWSDVSPYYFNSVTIDRRWDKHDRTV